ncbi:RagB/SusD family nutrient uptake outer membrane protein [Olivibacter sp. SDN3]|uniref:RagB/SusD family nutrient uptake outer membrane protein n=1 Tax=Olivibacter sp. SDN3 TaxID=2764720 RepID=UPI00165154B0|nr:RagB/SusD family nutrient uptake outer membrane protein [Olivibacter sp. SDN3]QNL50457.1 RagB/SusD family nutrient uptake outer membrane protein [Olivibacter sp. SDN3]
MKFRYTILLNLLTTLLLSSCNKALDMAPDGRLTMDEIFADHDKVGAFLNTCYNNIPTKGTRYYFWSRGPVVWSDEAWDTDAESEPTLMAGRIYNGNASAANHPILNVNADSGNGAYWDRYWEAIRNCNVFISRIDGATVGSEAERNRWRAEAHLLRAYYYSELMKWFGSALPVLTEPRGFEEDFADLQKASFYELTQFVIADCDRALDTDELPWRITTGGEAARVTKALAEAIKSKMILFAASPLYNGGQNYWEEAYQTNKLSLQHLRDNGYALYKQVSLPHVYLADEAFLGPDKNVHTALYNEYFTQNMGYSATPVDRETIYQSRENQGNIWYMDGVGAQDGYKTGTCPSQELVDAYETIDGEPVLDLANPYLDEKHLTPNYNSNNTLYNPNDPYANRDPRFYATIYYNGSKRKALWNFTEEPNSHENYPAPMGNRTRIIATYIGEPQTGLHESTRKATRTGYFQRKFLHPNSGNDNPVAGANWKFFRLGEIILNFAEAAAEADHLREAEDAINEIRERAGMPPIPVGLNKEALILRVRHERRIELALEEHRYFDVRRWTSPTGDLSKTDRWITAAEIKRNADGSFIYGRKTVRGVERRSYSNRNLILPIPLQEANRLQAITGQQWQNPGW